MRGERIACSTRVPARLCVPVGVEVCACLCAWIRRTHASVLLIHTYYRTIAKRKRARASVCGERSFAFGSVDF